MATAESRNGKAELRTCERILEREQHGIALQRMMLQSHEKEIALTLERILLLKRRDA